MSATSQSISARLVQQWLARGRLALQAGRRDEAVAAFRQAVATDSDHIDSLLWLAEICDDPGESLRHLTRVLALDPRNGAAHEGIRLARKRLGGRQPAQSAISNQKSTITAFAVPFVAVGFGLWLLLMGAMSAGIIWMLLHPSTDFSSAPIVAQAAAGEPADGAPQASSAAVPPGSGPQDPSASVREAGSLVPPASADAASQDADRAAAALREVDSAWARADWQQAPALIAQALVFRPGDPTLHRKLMTAYFNRAVSLMDSGDLNNALRAYNQALDVIPGDPQVQTERDTLVNYMAGVNSFNQRNWPAAIQTLTKVYGTDAGYLDVRALLYRANYNRGIELKQKKDLEGALKSFQLAVNLDNQAVEARGELAQVKAALAPPPPPVSPAATGAKWIDIDLTTQRFRALRGQTVAFSFVTSTGEPSRPTTAGRYEVLDKIPNAYSRFWNLWMPYWMGIYWAGSSENGIHALPILSDGQKLWAGFLGRRVSFGCVILDTSAAKLMYDWADIGTPVIIHY